MKNLKGKITSRMNTMHYAFVHTDKVREFLIILCIEKTKGFTDVRMIDIIHGVIKELKNNEI